MYSKTHIQHITLSPYGVLASFLKDLAASSQLTKTFFLAPSEIRFLSYAFQGSECEHGPSNERTNRHRYQFATNVIPILCFRISDALKLLVCPVTHVFRASSELFLFTLQLPFFNSISLMKKVFLTFTYFLAISLLLSRSSFLKFLCHFQEVLIKQCIHLLNLFSQHIKNNNFKI